MRRRPPQLSVAYLEHTCERSHRASMNLSLIRHVSVAGQAHLRILLTQRNDASRAAHSNKGDNILVVERLPNLALALYPL